MAQNTQFLIWDHPISFVHDVDIEQTLTREFFGAISRSDNRVPLHNFVVMEGTFINPMDGLCVPRHRGGSSGDKRYTNGKTFAAASQNRDVFRLLETDTLSTYIMDGCLIASTLAATTVVGPSLGSHVIDDLVEAFILNRARLNGWMQCHGAAWLENGYAHLAVGSSGAGKTTNLLSRITRGCQFLGNDRVFLRIADGVLQARGYPLAMNVGCGTIRGLSLDIPHYDGEDYEKIRLTPAEVCSRFDVDYENWWPVATITTTSKEDLIDNLYVEPDPSHPAWNRAWSDQIEPATAALIIEAATAETILNLSTLRKSA